MELFDLVAKLTLNTKEYETALKDAENQGSNMGDVEASLSLDTTEFDQAIEDANDAKVDDPEEPELDLDDEPFQTVVSDAEDAQVDDPEEPELDLDNQPFKDSLSEVADQELPTFEQSVGTTLDNIKGLIAGAGIAAAIVAVVNGLSEAVDLARSMGDNIDKSSRAMSISTDAYQEWGHVLEINGASITDLNRGLMNMRKLTQGGKVTDELADAFDKLGISATKADGSMKSVEEILDETMKALANYEGEDRDILAQAIFGRGGTKLNAMFDGTAEDIEGLKQQAHDLGLVMSEESVANAAAYNDAVTNMQRSMEAFKVAIGEQILPLLTDVTNRVAAIIAFFNPRNWNTSLADQFKGVDDELSENLLDIEATSNAAEKMIDKLFSMGDATKLTAEQQAEWKATAQWLKDNIPSLSEVIDTDTLSISANKDEVIALTKEWKNYAIERAKADALKAKQEALAKKTTQWLEAEAEAARLEAEEEKARQKVLEIARRDIEAMPEDRRNAFLAGYGYPDIDSLLADEKKSRWAYEALINPESEWGRYGSRELQSVYGSYWGNIENTATATKEAKDKAADLKAEVEDGQRELAEYSATLDDVIGNLSDTGDQADGTSEKVGGLAKRIKELPDGKTIIIDTIFRTSGSPTALPKAKGDWNVPYDMPVMVHRGETILTSSEARRYRNGEGSGDVDLSGLRSEIVGAIKEGMQDAQVNSYLDGRRVSEEVNRYNNSDLASRRFAP